MKLTRLRLLGFKSFVEPTDFLIEPGLTGVVGPNGCGKSNLVEALRWVMGETSHKSLRAADMDDVIFSGTNSRPGRNNAEVAIQIDALKRQARQAIRYRAVAERVRKAEATLFHLRWVAANAELAEAEQAKSAAVRLVAARSGEQAEASKRQALAAAELPALREAEVRAAAALQRLTMARETLDREETRATERMAELDRRLVQLGDDIERERRLAADAQAALARLASEEAELQREGKANDQRRAGVGKRVAQAHALLVRSGKAADEPTGTPA